MRTGGASGTSVGANRAILAALAYCVVPRVCRQLPAVFVGVDGFVRSWWPSMVGREM
jgi:hypothetical protein